MSHARRLPILLLSLPLLAGPPRAPSRSSRSPLLRAVLQKKPEAGCIAAPPRRPAKCGTSSCGTRAWSTSSRARPWCAATWLRAAAQSPISTPRRWPSGPAPTTTTALSAWRSFGHDLGFLCEAVIALLDPEVIVIGGSLARASDLFRPALLARLEKHPTRIAEAELGPAAGVIGAAALNIA